MLKLSIRVVLGVAAVVAVIFVPRVAFFDVTVLFNNGVQPTAAGWGVIGLAAVLLANVMFLQEKAMRGNTLSLMLLVYQGVCFVSAVDERSALGCATSFSWGGVGLALMLVMRLWLKPPQESWSRVVLRLDAVRLSAVVFLMAQLHLAKGGEFSAWGACVTVAVIVWPFVAGRVWFGFSASIEAGKSLLGTARWILAFAVAGDAISWVAGSSGGNLLGYTVLAASGYVVCAVWETPSRELWAAELLGVFGSGVATTLHLALTDLSLWNNTLLVGYGGFCLFLCAVMVRKRLPS